MKTFLITTIVFLAFSITCSAQWTPGTGVITTSNSVGIGTTSPAEKLVIAGTGNTPQLRLANTDAGSLAAWNIGNDAAFAYGLNIGEVGVANGRLFIKPGGNVGIGTTSPSAALQIGDFLSGASSNQIVIPGTYNFEQVRLGQIGNGNSALEFVNHNGPPSSYGIKFLIDVDHGASGLQIQYAPATTSYASLSYTTGLYLNLAGNVGIGTTTPDQKLTVNGTIHSKSVVVDANIFPDYVFNKDYALPSLTEVKTYIDQNHHLPDVPSAAEVEKNGLNLGEMNKVLVQKVEELTLYLIEQNKHLADQQKTNQSQQKQIDEMKKSLDKLNHKKHN
ncbi:tail fiber protein [Mucilaginibacter sp. OK098]|uniref:tail fiber protein n=1 Tax=Mucilaginibacter sp. OK098 TaxID=1855297 RepID=UPI00116148EC|nr:tail fiber protein [Mucilaginibacter sp. OK098]